MDKIGINMNRKNMDKEQQKYGQNSNYHSKNMDKIVFGTNRKNVDKIDIIINS